MRIVLRVLGGLVIALLAIVVVLMGATVTVLLIGILAFMTLPPKSVRVIEARLDQRTWKLVGSGMGEVMQ